MEGTDGRGKTRESGQEPGELGECLWNRRSWRWILLRDPSEGAGAGKVTSVPRFDRWTQGEAMAGQDGQKITGDGHLRFTSARAEGMLPQTTHLKEMAGSAVKFRNSKTF